MATGKEEKLKSFELIKAVHLEAEPWSVDNDLLTPTFKLRRPQLQKRYQADIDALCVLGGEVGEGCQFVGCAKFDGDVAAARSTPGWHLR